MARKVKVAAAQVDMIRKQREIQPVAEEGNSRAHLNNFDFFFVCARARDDKKKSTTFKSCFFACLCYLNLTFRLSRFVAAH